jgi:hypothetical protein
MCAFIFSATFSWNTVRSKKNKARYSYDHIYISLHVTCPLFLSHFDETWIFNRFSKNTQTWNLMKIRPVVAKLFHAGGWGRHGEDKNCLFPILRTRLKSNWKSDISHSYQDQIKSRKLLPFSLESFLLVYLEVQRNLVSCPKEMDTEWLWTAS